MKKIAFAVALLAVVNVPARTDEPKWGAHIDVEGKAGSERHLGEIDFFMPVAQDDATLAFVNIRGRADNDGGREGNVGLGVRRMLDSGWNLGGYAYFDRRSSHHDNLFNQITVGASAHSVAGPG